MASRVIIYGPNINVGGGKILLQSIINDWPEAAPVYYYLDVRARDTLGTLVGSNAKWVKPTIFSRLSADFALAKQADNNTVILLLNGLPPFFMCKGTILSYMQNRNLIEKISLREFRFRVALRLFMERHICYFLRHRVHEYIVQTPSFKSVLQLWYQSRFSSTSKPVKITVLPFLQKIIPNAVEANLAKPLQFFYVADGEAHKNHNRLFDAWEHLDKEGIFPTLGVTIEGDNQALINRISVLKERGIRVINLGHLPHHKILEQYQKADYLIYPSLRESFGIPLIEASNLNVPIIASELDYVYDVCDPVETFDPLSSKSIARAVKRVLKQKEDIIKILSPAAFCAEIQTRLNNLSTSTPQEHPCQKS